MEIIPEDEYYPQQWYARSDGLDYEADMDIMGAWEQGSSGSYIYVSVISRAGLQYFHDELSENSANALDACYDFVHNSPDATTKAPGRSHGTAIAGIISAQRNEHCIIGVAYNSTLSAVRISGAIGHDAEIGKALSFSRSITDVYCNAWLFAGEQQQFVPVGPITIANITTGIKEGRRGTGSIYIFPANPSYTYSSSTVYDGYANLPYTITVGYIDKSGKLPVDVPGMNVHGPGLTLVVAIPTDSHTGVPTTDVGSDLSDLGYCNPNFYHRDVAAAITSGVVALILEKNHHLSWWDVQNILVTCNRVSEKLQNINISLPCYIFPNHSRISSRILIQLASPLQSSFV